MTILALERGEVKTLHGSIQGQRRWCPTCNAYLRVVPDVAMLFCPKCKEFWKFDEERELKR